MKPNHLMPMLLPRPAQLLGALAIFGLSATAGAADLILNEANAVGPRKWLANPDSVACECAGGSACSAEADVFFGRSVGNGGDWIEFVVATDHLDIRGWQLRWAETDNTPGNANQANGTNIWYGSGNIEQGLITFSADPLWADLRAGTIVTITESTTSQGGLDTDTSFDPCAGDWWINVNASSAQYLSTQINISLNSDGCTGPATVPPGAFNVGNDNWELTIVTDDNRVVLGPIGEAMGGVGWLGSGINSRETIRLSENPSAGIGNLSYYEDCDQSSFGHPNRWSDDVGVGLECARSQDFRALRTWCDCPCARLVLNEYNAVGEQHWLGNPDIAGGACPSPLGPGGQACSTAADSRLGRVMGNGGDWFELIAADDHLDLRGWSFHWEETADGQSGVITLSNDGRLADIRAGTIITFTRRLASEGGADSDLSYSAATGDRWININTKDAALVASTSSTVASHGFGDFHTSNDDWRLTILDTARREVLMSTGEGSDDYGGRGVGATEVCALQENPSSDTRSWGLYTESVLSTFGSPNRWQPCPGTALVTQGTAALGSKACTRAADINANGAVNVDDLLAAIGGWGPCPTPGISCTGDVNDNGVVNVDDLLAVINGWG